jgi:hypothetical protein
MLPVVLYGDDDTYPPQLMVNPTLQASDEKTPDLLLILSDQISRDQITASAEILAM